jgi:hypothetical protein
MRSLVLPLTFGALLLTACPSSQPAQTPGENAAPAVQPSEPASQPTGALPSGPKGTTPDDRNSADPDGVIRRGEALSANAPISVDEAFTNAKSLAGKTVKIQGKVSTVCAKKGCWFELKGQGEQGIRITAKGYGFFVPAQAAGMSAVIEGELSVGELDQATAQHYEDDKVEGTGQPAKKISGPVAELAVVAAGLEMRQGG